MYLKVKRVKVIPPLARYILAGGGYSHTNIASRGGWTLIAANGTRHSSLLLSENVVCKGEIGHRFTAQLLDVYYVYPTQVSDVIAGLVERPGVELKSDDGKDDDGEEEEQRNVDQGTDGLGDGGHDHLQT